MRNLVNDDARPVRWQRKAADFVNQIWSQHDEGFAFLATRCIGPNTDWKDHVFEIGDNYEDLVKHFSKFHRNEYDHYFCPNSFTKKQRLNSFALPTPYSWVDIDDADPDEFDPSPSILWETSPKRFQGIWVGNSKLDVTDAERYSKGLAYEHGADRGGWSVTKYLRTPYTFNHKPKYDQPTVKLIAFDMSPKDQRKITIIPSGKGKFSKPFNPIGFPMSEDWKNVLNRYKSKLHPRVCTLIKSRHAYAFERNRSKVIYEIVVDLHKAGACPDEIYSVLCDNPYFISKHGQNADKIFGEISRITRKVDGAS